MAKAYDPKYGYVVCRVTMADQWHSTQYCSGLREARRIFNETIKEGLRSDKKIVLAAGDNNYIIDEITRE